jgi:hypothetical protein
MTKKDLFRITIKIISVYSVIFTFLSLLENYISIIYNQFYSITTLWVIMYTLFNVFVFSILFFKTDKIISFLRLDKGFDSDNISLEKLDTESVIKIASVIVGFLLIIENISEFASHMFYSFKYSVEPKLHIDNSYTKEDYLRWTVCGLQILIGYLIILNTGKISKWLNKSK